MPEDRRPRAVHLDRVREQRAAVVPRHGDRPGRRRVDQSAAQRLEARGLRVEVVDHPADVAQAAGAEAVGRGQRGVDRVHDGQLEDHGSPGGERGGVVEVRRVLDDRAVRERERLEPHVLVDQERPDTEGLDGAVDPRVEVVDPVPEMMQRTHDVSHSVEVMF